MRGQIKLNMEDILTLVHNELPKELIYPVGWRILQPSKSLELLRKKLIKSNKMYDLLNVNFKYETNFEGKKQIVGISLPVKSLMTEEQLVEYFKPFVPKIIKSNTF